MLKGWTSPRRTRMLSLGQKKTCIWLGSSSSCNSFPSLGFSFFSALPPFRCFLAFELAFSGQVRECTSLIENSPTSSEEEVKILRTSIRKSFREYKGVLVSQVAIDIRSTIWDGAASSRECQSARHWLRHPALKRDFEFHLRLLRLELHHIILYREVAVSLILHVVRNLLRSGIGQLDVLDNRMPSVH